MAPHVLGGLDFVGLLGPIEFRSGEQVLSHRLSRKTLALMGYLFVHPKPQRRRGLAELLWSQAEDPMATLRWNLSQLRKHLGPERLQSDRQFACIVWEPEGLDLCLFERWLEGEPEEAQLQRAIELYRGEFLEQLSTDAPDFELWLLGERHRLKRLYEGALEQLIDLRLRSSDAQGALPHALALVRSDPLREESHVRLIQIYTRLGQLDAAQQQLEACTQRLRSELGVEPLDSTRKLCGAQRAPAAEPGRGTEGEAASTEPLRRGTEAGALWRGGRAALAEFEGCFDRCQRSNRSFMMLLQAPGGGGKSRALEELSRRVTEAQVWELRCYATERHSPYRPWIELLEARESELSEEQRAQIPDAIWGQLARLLPALAFERGWPLEPPPAEALEFEAFATAIQLFIARLASSAPLCLAWDDLHWSDQASLRLLAHLLRARPRGAPCFVLATCSEDQGLAPILVSLEREGRLSRYTLPGLEPRDIAQLLEQRAPEVDVPTRQSWQQLLDEMDERRPLSIELLLDDWKKRYAAGQEISGSSSLRQWLQERCELCSSEVRQVLEALAVLQRPSPISRLQMTSGRSEEEVLRGLEFGLQAGLLERQIAGPEPEYGWSHGALQEAMYEDIAAARRPLLHRRAAGAWERSKGRPELLAHHYSLAQEREKAVHYATLAGQKAARCWAFEASTRHFQLALEWSTAPEQRASLWRMLAEVLDASGETPEARSALQAAFAELDSKPEAFASERGRCLLAQGRLERRQGELPAAFEALEQAEQRFALVGDGPAQCAALSERARTLRHKGHWAEAMDAYQRQLQLATKLLSQTDSPDSARASELRCEALSALCSLQQQLGQPEDAMASFRALLEEYQAQRDEDEADSQASPLTLSGILGAAGCFEQEPYNQALEALEREAQHSQSAEASQRLAWGLNQLSALHTWRGDLQAAFDQLLTHWQWALEGESLTGLNKIVGDMAELYRFVGEYDKAERCYTYRLALSLDLKQRRPIATSLGRLAEIFWLQGKAEDAHLPLELALGLCQDCGFTKDRVSLLLLEAQLDGEEAHLDEAIELAQTHGLEPQWMACQLAQLRMQWERRSQDDAALLRSLDELLASADHDKDRAKIFHLMAEIDSSYAPRARQAYQSSFAQAPDARLAFGYRQLFGQELQPSPPPLPPLPPLLQRFRRPLTRLYPRAQKLLSRLRPTA